MASFFLVVLVSKGLMTHLIRHSGHPFSAKIPLKVSSSPFSVAGEQILCALDVQDRISAIFCDVGEKESHRVDSPVNVG